MNAKLLVFVAAFGLVQGVLDQESPSNPQINSPESLEHTNQQPNNPSDLLGDEIGHQTGVVRGMRQKRATCLSWNGGGDCRKKCQGMKASSTEKCYCTGACEWSEFILTCECKDPHCDC